VCALMCCVVYASSHVIAGDSYGDLAMKLCFPSFQKALSLLPVLKNGTMPGDVHTMRKALLAARNLFDIFVYAYPIVPLNKSELFQVLYTDVSDGYVWIGHFQDLENVNYTKQDYDTLLGRCLVWKANFLNDITKYKYNDYIKSPEKNAIVMRPKSELSILFWGRVPEVPQANLSGQQNVALLGGAIIKEAMDSYDHMIHLQEIWLKKYHTQFHDYRKLLRSIEYVAGTFPKMFGKENVTQDMAVVDKAYGLFGKLNDVIGQYTYFLDHNQTGEANATKAQIIVMWGALKAWLTDVKFRDMLQLLYNAVKNPLPPMPHSTLNHNKLRRRRLVDVEEGHHVVRR